MKRSGFTMIELIFVIVILGILASVAIPKLAATRDDAKISKMASNIETAKNEIAAHVVASGDNNATPNEAWYTGASNVITAALDKGDATFAANTITFVDRDNSEDCTTLAFNGTSIVVADINASTGPICVGIHALVSAGTIEVRGRRVVY